MAVGLAPAVANALLDALANGTNYTAPTARHIQFHVGDPGAAGTANVATETDRVDISASFPSAASGLVSNDVAISITNVAGSEDFTYYSVWTATSAGSFLWSGVITANAVTAGDTFTIPVGDLDLSFNVAA